MPITAQELAQRALLLLSAGDVNSPWHAMEVEASLAIGQSLEELGVAIAEHPTRFGILQQDYSVTLDSTTGAGDLTTATGSLTLLADIIWEKVKNGRVKDSNSVPLHYIPDVAEFEASVLPGLNYYTLYQGKIYTRTSLGDYVSDRNGVSPSGPLTVTANYYPSVGSAATLPLEVESDAIRALAQTLLERFPNLTKPGVIAA